MITFSFLNQTLWCDPHWNRLSETIPMSGNIIGFGWETRKLAFRKLQILDLICCPGGDAIFLQGMRKWIFQEVQFDYSQKKTYKEIDKCVNSLLESV